MTAHTPAFSLAVDEVAGTCPAGKQYAIQQAAHRRIPVLSCEGPCIRGEIARLAANMIASEDDRLARACHAETFFVPHSAMNKWVLGANRVLMIDSCFLQCHGRVLRTLVPTESVVHIDAHRIHRQFADSFSPDEVPEAARTAAAKCVADAARGLVNASLGS